MPNLMKALFTSISHSPWVRPTVIVDFSSTTKGQGSSQSPQDYYLSEVSRLHKSRHITHQFRLPTSSLMVFFTFFCQSSDRFRRWFYVFPVNFFIAVLGSFRHFVWIYHHVVRSATVIWPDQPQEEHDSLFDSIFRQIINTLVSDYWVCHMGIFMNKQVTKELGVFFLRSGVADSGKLVRHP